MESKIMRVYYGNDCLPYKDKERQVHFPIIGNAFQGASNTTEIHFYIGEIGDENTTWVALTKLPNGKTGSRLLTCYQDNEGLWYAKLQLNSFYTQYKGDIYISLQGFNGGIVLQPNGDDTYTPVGDAVIQATGSVKITIAYATGVLDGGEYENITLPEIAAYIGTRLAKNSGKYLKVVSNINKINDSEYADYLNIGDIVYCVAGGQFIRLVAGELEGTFTYVFVNVSLNRLQSAVVTTNDLQADNVVVTNEVDLETNEAQLKAKLWADIKSKLNSGYQTLPDYITERLESYAGNDLPYRFIDTTNPPTWEELYNYYGLNKPFVIFGATPSPAIFVIIDRDTEESTYEVYGFIMQYTGTFTTSWSDLFTETSFTDAHIEESVLNIVDIDSDTHVVDVDLQRLAFGNSIISHSGYLYRKTKTDNDYYYFESLIESTTLSGVTTLTLKGLKVAKTNGSYEETAPTLITTYNKTYIDNMETNILEVVNGKCKSIVVSYADSHSAIETYLTDNPTKKVYTTDGTDITTAFLADTLGTTYPIANTYLNSTNNHIGADGYLAEKNANGDYVLYLCDSQLQESYFNNGDIIIVSELNVPDRWVDERHYYYSALETAKVDVTGVAKLSEDNVFTGHNTMPDLTLKYNDSYNCKISCNNYGRLAIYDRTALRWTIDSDILPPTGYGVGNLGSTTHVLNSVNAYRHIFGTDAQIERSAANTIAFGLGSLNASDYKYVMTTGAFRPNSNGSLDLGSYSYHWRNLHLSGTIYANNENYGVVMPDTSGYTQDKDLATVQDIFGFPEYDDTLTYALGSRVIFKGVPYQCTTAITTAESWDDTHWTAINVSSGFARESQGFNVINASDIANNTLTQAQYDLITNGKPTLIKGIFLSLTNIFIETFYETSSNTLCMYTSMSEHGCLNINKSTLVVSKESATIQRYNLRGINQLNGKTLPVYPSSTGTFNFRLVGGTLAYKALGSYVADNTITELSYDDISVIELSADTTFTLAIAPSGTYPEYKAKITNESAVNAITITLPSGTIIKAESGITVSNNTFEIPYDTTIILSVQDDLALVMIKE